MAAIAPHRHLLCSCINHHTPHGRQEASDPATTTSTAAQKAAKEKFKKTPLDASEELDYIKRLLSGEDVGNFGPEEPLELQGDNPVYWASGNPYLYSATLSEFLSGTTIKQRKRK